ncbi:unnamed protein product [Darwinula stevensoni]|uniref:Uncharacterized protein n=1 Tax=Darwinula stevensoni TaxID=69355 RepID=A0A7R9FRQ7_9CRUS|nr:unnamed protein product [Darwinula stevensoni]CAG0901917.1 unnamed protein product [Darwinula stevensoni]
MLIAKAANSCQYLSAKIYGASLILLFTVSFCYHLAEYIPFNTMTLNLCHRMDRAMIYVFISANYYPWVLLLELPRDSWVTHLSWGIWVLAFLGITYQQIFHEKYKLIEVTLYLIVGALPGLVLQHTIDEVEGFIEMAIGGLLYIVGVGFFRSDGKIPFAHAIWHVHVVAASTCHFYAVHRYLLGRTNLPEGLHCQSI